MRSSPALSFVKSVTSQWTSRETRYAASRAAGGSTVVLRRCQSTAPPSITLLDNTYPIDEWTNIPNSISSSLSRKLHLQPSHPVSLTRKLIASRFPSPRFNHYDDLAPIVTTEQNFDSLGFPPNHPGRSKTDTYYVNANTCLRTHSSAHQRDTFRKDASNGYTVTADVYRRDAIDRSHYPIFHQMEGALTWDRRELSGEALEKAVWADYQNLPKHDLVAEDSNPTSHPTRNPIQSQHSIAEVEAIAAHLKRSLEDVVVTILSTARSASASAGTTSQSAEPLRVRWIEAYFPFTSPSWELEVQWQGEWLELLGCGIVTHDVLSRASVPHKIGWAFGIGLERIAMLLYGIPDIRLFWSRDARFLGQFHESKPHQLFIPFSKHPPCWKDVAFWLPMPAEGEEQGRLHLAGAAAVGGMGVISSTGAKPSLSSSTHVAAAKFHENDMMELVREVAGDMVEDVKLVDDFTHPRSGRRSLCYRINYRSLERTLRNSETNELHGRVGKALVERMGVQLR